MNERKRGRWEKGRQADRDKRKSGELLGCSNLLVQVRYLQPPDRRGLNGPLFGMFFIDIAVTSELLPTFLEWQLC
jgi:hypothetical protein